MGQSHKIIKENRRNSFVFHYLQGSILHITTEQKMRYFGIYDVSFAKVTKPPDTRKNTSGVVVQTNGRVTKKIYEVTTGHK